MSARRPPGGPGRPVEVLRIPAEGSTIVVFLGPLRGHLEHWQGRTTAPCPGVASCRPAVHALRSVFYAYAPVGYFDPQSGRCDPWVLQATAAVEEQLRGRQLRGEVWALSRYNPQDKRSKVVCKLVEQRPAKELPDAFDVRPALRRMFQVSELYLDVPNPAPLPTVLDAFQVAPLDLGPPGTEIPIYRLTEEERAAERARREELARRKGLKT